MSDKQNADYKRSRGRCSNCNGIRNPTFPPDQRCDCRAQNDGSAS